MSPKTLTGLAVLSLLVPAALSAQTGTIRYERSVTRDLTQAAAFMRPQRDGADAPPAGRKGGRSAGGQAGGAAQGGPTMQRYSELTVTFDGTAVLTRIAPMEIEQRQDRPGASDAPQHARALAGGGGDVALVHRIAQAMPTQEEHSVWVDPMAGRYVRGVEFLTRDFRIEGDVPALRWRFLGEESDYLGYVVQKAEAEHEGRVIEAWFTVEIPGFVAPDVFTGLPGVVLMVSIDRGETLIQATEVDLETPIEALAPPTEGESISPEDFEALVEEKTQEFRQQVQTRVRRIGGGG